MEETIAACTAEIRYIPLYLPDASVTQLTAFDMVRAVAPLAATVLLFCWLAFVAWVWWKFVEVGRYRVLLLEEHDEVPHVRRISRLAS